jgi:benzoylformate decarboxylase
LRNAEYAILKWFAQIEGVGGAPALDLPALSCVEVANGYGVAAGEVGGDREELIEALRAAIDSERPELIEVPVAEGMWLF